MSARSFFGYSREEYESGEDCREEDEGETWEYWNGRAMAAEQEAFRLRTALRRIVSLGEKNVPQYAQHIAREALAITSAMGKEG